MKVYYWFKFHAWGTNQYRDLKGHIPPISIVEVSEVALRRAKEHKRRSAFTRRGGPDITISVGRPLQIPQYFFILKVYYPLGAVLQPCILNGLSINVLIYMALHINKGGGCGTGPVS